MPTRIAVAGPPARSTGLGMCEACNYTKEAPGWVVTTEIDETGRHTAEFTTPTGAHYHSIAPPAPGTPATAMTEIEVYLNGELLEVIAA